MAHFTCVGATVPELRATLDEMERSKIDNVLALRGDPPAGQERWTKTEGGLEYSRELVELIDANYEFAIGAACFPETHIHAESPQADLEHLAQKVDAGVDFLITQLFFDNACYFEFIERARAIGIEVPIIPGIMPITHAGQVQRMAQMCAAKIPEGLRAELREREEHPEAVLDFGVAYATLQCAELLEAGAPGIHFYTLNRSPATRAILSAPAGAPGGEGLGARAGGGSPARPRRARLSASASRTPSLAVKRTSTESSWRHVPTPHARRNQRQPLILSLRSRSNSAPERTGPALSRWGRR
jgi:methylenetetrahydrofolate reductase (NADPH)